MGFNTRTTLGGKTVENEEGKGRKRPAGKKAKVPRKSVVWQGHDNSHTSEARIMSEQDKWTIKKMQLTVDVGKPAEEQLELLRRKNQNQILRVGGLSLSGV